MAREIQPTPVLEGQDAIDFLIKLETYPQYLKEKGIVLSRKKMEESAKFLKSISLHYANSKFRVQNFIQ